MRRTESGRESKNENDEHTWAIDLIPMGMRPVCTTHSPLPHHSPPLLFIPSCLADDAARLVHLFFVRFGFGTLDRHGAHDDVNGRQKARRRFADRPRDDGKRLVIVQKTTAANQPQVRRRRRRILRQWTVYKTI